jgi:hypothetical protein
MKYFVILMVLVCYAGFIENTFADQIPEYLNVTVPPNQIVPTDEHGNILNQNI